MIVLFISVINLTFSLISTEWTVALCYNMLIRDKLLKRLNLSFRISGDGATTQIGEVNMNPK